MYAWLLLRSWPLPRLTTCSAEAAQTSCPGAAKPVSLYQAAVVSHAPQESPKKANSHIGYHKLLGIDGYARVEIMEKKTVEE